MNSIDQRLRRIAKIVDLSDAEHDEANALAFTIVELEESAHALISLSEKSRSLNEMSDSEVEDWLYELGETLRNLVRHMRSNRFLAVYTDDVD